MKEKSTRDLWEYFINNNKYKQYFESNENQWINKLEEVKLKMLYL